MNSFAMQIMIGIMRHPRASALNVVFSSDLPLTRSSLVKEGPPTSVVGEIRRSRCVNLGTPACHHGYEEHGYTPALMPLPSQSDLTREVELNVYINSYRELHTDVNSGVLEHTWDTSKRSDVPIGKRILSFTSEMKREKYPNIHVQKYKARFCVRGDLQIESDYLFNKGLKNNFANLRMKLMGW